MSDSEKSSLDRLWDAFDKHTEQDAERFGQVTNQITDIRLEMAKSAGKMQIVIPLLTTAAMGVLWGLQRVAEWLLSAHSGH